MEEQSTPFETHRLALGALGFVLLLAGVAVALWAIGIISEALYHPDEIPLLQSFVDPDRGEIAFHVARTDDTFTIYGSRLLPLILLVGLLLASLGGIISAMITSGVNLLGDATWRSSAPRWRKRKDGGNIQT